MALISIIVPVYKVEDYLEECIDSILNQSFKDFELILVDDGSPDNCPLICDNYAKKDNRVFVIHKKNGGLSSARNAGLDYIFQKSNSRYISFIDSDDYVKKDFLEKLFYGIKNSDITMCYMSRFDEFGTRRKEYSFSGVTDSINFWKIKGISPNDVVVCNKLYKKQIFSNIRFPVGKIHEDEFVMHYVIGDKLSINIIKDYLYLYRIREKSITGLEKKIDKKYIQTLLEINIDRMKYYSAILCSELFIDCLNKSIDILVRYYRKHPIKLVHFFFVIKKYWKKSTKIGRKKLLGERCFFLFPILYSLIRHF